MSADGEDPPADEGLGRPSLAGRVATTRAAGGVAYVPARVLVRGPEAETQLKRLAGAGRPASASPERTGLGRRAGRENAEWAFYDKVAEPEAIVELLRAEGFDAQLDHVLFAHGCGPCDDAPHPSLTFGADPFKANPFKANPFKANPFKANPFKANPFKANDVQYSSAVPASERSLPVVTLDGPGSHPHIVVLDTGLAGGEQDGVINPDGQRPPLLDPAPAKADERSRIFGALDRPDSTISLAAKNVPADRWLDPVAGHGTFITGLIEQLAPGCTVEVISVVSPLGDARETKVHDTLMDLAERPDADHPDPDHPDVRRPDIVSMSFGGPVLDAAPLMRSAVATLRATGTVIVASAGNDGTSTRQFPAAYPTVIAVGAIGPAGPAPWTNYGDWVDACAPGVDLVSAFFNAFDGASPRVNTFDPDHFAGWATWSGTSFSAPVVVAALAREMVLGRCGAGAAAERVVHAPHLLRIPCLGTVVNL